MGDAFALSVSPPILPAKFADHAQKLAQQWMGWAQRPVLTFAPFPNLALLTTEKQAL